MEAEQFDFSVVFPNIAAQLRSVLGNLHLAAAQLAPAIRREGDPALDSTASLLDQSYYRLLRLVDSEDFWRYLVECHAALVQALALHDHEAAVAALTREFDLYEPLLAEYMARRPDYFAA